MRGALQFTWRDFLAAARAAWLITMAIDGLRGALLTVYEQLIASGASYGHIAYLMVFVLIPGHYLLRATNRLLRDIISKKMWVYLLLSSVTAAIIRGVIRNVHHPMVDRVFVCVFVLITITLVFQLIMNVAHVQTPQRYLVIFNMCILIVHWWSWIDFKVASLLLLWNAIFIPGHVDVAIEIHEQIETCAAIVWLMECVRTQPRVFAIFFM